MNDEPRRLLDDPGVSGALRAALEAGRELPTDAELASLAARLAPLLGPGGGGGAAASAASGASAAVKGAAGVLAAAATAGLVWWAASHGEPRASAPPRREPAAVAQEAEPAPVVPEGIDPPPDLELPREEAPPRPPARPRAPAFEVDPEAELALIRSAQDALRTSPSAALARTEEHRRRFGDDGTLAQEREVIAIEALMRAGREAEARARAAAFAARWPRSAHRRRVEVLVAPH